MSEMESHAAYGIRVGDRVLWQAPGGYEGIVESVDYPAGLAFVRWGRQIGTPQWAQIDDLFVVMEVTA